MTSAEAVPRDPDSFAGAVISVPDSRCNRIRKAPEEKALCHPPVHSAMDVWPQHRCIAFEELKITCSPFRHIISQ